MALATPSAALLILRQASKSPLALVFLLLPTGKLLKSLECLIDFFIELLLLVALNSFILVAKLFHFKIEQIREAFVESIVSATAATAATATTAETNLSFPNQGVSALQKLQGTLLGG